MPIKNPTKDLFMKPDYSTPFLKENTPELNLNDYIHYLYKEVKSKITNPTPKIYDQIKQFVNSPEGQEGFEKFKYLNPDKVGIQKHNAFNPFKKVS